MFGEDAHSPPILFREDAMGGIQCPIVRKSRLKIGQKYFFANGFLLQNMYRKIQKSAQVHAHCCTDVAFIGILALAIMRTPGTGWNRCPVDISESEPEKHPSEPEKVAWNRKRSTFSGSTLFSGSRFRSNNAVPGSRFRFRVTPGKKN